MEAVNYALKCEVIANHGILDMVGWEQEPTIVQEDNVACVGALKTTQITRGHRYLYGSVKNPGSQVAVCNRASNTHHSLH